MRDLVQRFNLCAYQIVADGDIAVRCDRPCMGLYCLEHTVRIGQVEELEKEVDRLVKGRIKK
jgi:hypothetical protein